MKDRRPIGKIAHAVTTSDVSLRPQARRVEPDVVQPIKHPTLRVSPGASTFNRKTPTK